MFVCMVVQSPHTCNGASESESDIRNLRVFINKRSGLDLKRLFGLNGRSVCAHGGGGVVVVGRQVASCDVVGRCCWRDRDQPFHLLLFGSVSNLN